MRRGLIYLGGCIAVSVMARSVVYLTHRGKPPALPGDSPGFDLYDGRCEFLISTRRKEIHDERISEPEPYEMGLQASHCFHTEASQEGSIWCTAATFGGDVSRVSLAQGVKDCGGAHDGRSRSHVLEHFAEVCGIKCRGIFKREEYDSDCTEVWKAAEELHGRAFPGSRIFCLDGWIGREYGSSIHPQPGRRG